MLHSVCVSLFMHCLICSDSKINYCFNLSCNTSFKSLWLINSCTWMHNISTVEIKEIHDSIRKLLPAFEVCCNFSDRNRCCWNVENHWPQEHLSLNKWKNDDNICYILLYFYPSNNRPGYEVALDIYRLITIDATLTIVLQVYEGKSRVHGISNQQRSRVERSSQKCVILFHRFGFRIINVTSENTRLQRLAACFWSISSIFTIRSTYSVGS